MKRVLFLSTCSSDDLQARSKDELKEIRRNLDKGIVEKRVQVASPDEEISSKRLFLGAINEHVPNILHISGEVNKEKGIIIGRAEKGGANFLSEDEFEEWVKEYNIECVVLNCNDSRNHAIMISPFIKYVIAYKGNLNAEEAIDFCTPFYKELSEEKYNIEQAYNKGKRFARLSKNRYESEDGLSLFLIKSKWMMNKKLFDTKDFDIMSKKELVNAVEKRLKEKQESDQYIIKTIKKDFVNSEHKDLVKFLVNNKVKLVKHTIEICFEENIEVTRTDFGHALSLYLDNLMYSLEDDDVKNLNKLIHTTAEWKKPDMLVKGIIYLGRLTYQMRDKTIKDKSMIFFGKCINHLAVQLKK